MNLFVTVVLYLYFAFFKPEWQFHRIKLVELELDQQRHENLTGKQINE